MTQTMRYSTQSGTKTLESGSRTETPSPESSPQAIATNELEEPIITPTATLKPVTTDKSDRYEEKAAPRWPFWLSILLFAVIGIFIYTRKNTL